MKMFDSFRPALAVLSAVCGFLFVASSISSNAGLPDLSGHYDFSNPYGNTINVFPSGGLFGYEDLYVRYGPYAVRLSDADAFRQPVPVWLYPEPKVFVPFLPPPPPPAHPKPAVAPKHEPPKPVRAGNKMKYVGTVYNRNAAEPPASPEPPPSATVTRSRQPVPNGSSYRTVPVSPAQGGRAYRTIPATPANGGRSYKSNRATPANGGRAYRTIPMAPAGNRAYRTVPHR